MEKSNVSPLTFYEDGIISHFAFDGTYYYFTILSKAVIVKTTTGLEIKNIIETNQIYECICYDAEKFCFWASKKRQYNVIYKLDLYMKEIDCIAFEGSGKISGEIVSLSYHSCNHCILVAYPSLLVELHKDGTIRELFYEADTCIGAVLSICPNYFLSLYRAGRQYIYQLNERGRLIKEIPIDLDLKISTMVFMGESEVLSVSYTAYLYENYPHMGEKCLKPSDINCICDCNFFDMMRGEEGREGNQFLYDVVRIEHTLASILDAEFEKLQEYLETTKDIKELLVMNQEMKELIMHATHLQQVVYSILSLTVPRV